MVVEGPIGVGKTTLAQRLAETFGSDLILEAAGDNPFLPRFYEDPRKSALPTQLFFLFQRVQQIQSMRQSDLFKPVQVADFLLEKDRLFAEVTLNREELQLYEQVYRQMTIDAPAPDLVIYLQAPVRVLMRRIAQRGIAYEQRIETDYLEELVQAYVRFFHDYEAAPLLIVNAADIDIVNSERDYRLLVEQVGRITSGRHYFNPMAA
jgi:deoxyadenosine/deoxycytidine kinase